MKIESITEMDDYKKQIIFNAALYVANRLPKEQCRLHKVFKILWFADMEHLKKYGRTITGAKYSALPYGPVPSVLYDEIKCKKTIFERYDVGVEKGFLTPLKPADEFYLSETDKEELNAAVEKYKDKSFEELLDLSHKSAYNSTAENGEISLESILDEIGASEELRKYIRENSLVEA